MTLNNENCMRTSYFSILGGIPWYLEQITPGQTADSLIKQLCFEKEVIFGKRAILVKRASLEQKAKKG